MLSNVKIDTKSDSRAQAYEHNSYLLIYTIADLKNYPDMALPPIATATLQAALVNAGSNVLAQGIKAWRDQVRRTRLHQRLNTIKLTIIELGENR